MDGDRLDRLARIREVRLSAARRETARAEEERSRAEAALAAIDDEIARGRAAIAAAKRLDPGSLATAESFAARERLVEVRTTELRAGERRRGVAARGLAERERACDAARVAERGAERAREQIDVLAERVAADAARVAEIAEELEAEAPRRPLLAPPVGPDGDPAKGRGETGR